MPKELKPARHPLPHFKSEAEERAFWESHDTTDDFDWSKAQRVRFPNLKLSASLQQDDAGTKGRRR